MNKKATPKTRYKQAGHLAKFENGFVFEKLVITESLGFLNPSLRVAQELYRTL